MFESVLIPFGTILIAELLDKSQLAILLLASKTKKHLQLLLGVFFAFLLVDGLAVFLGSFLTNLIPLVWVQIASAAFFILYGIKSLLEKETETVHIGKVSNTFFSAFWLIFLSEWGDKTQLASAVFATRFDPAAVLFGVMLAMMLIATGTVLLSKVLSKKIKPGIISKIAGFVFITLGISFVLFR